MAVKVIVKNVADPAYSEEFVYNQSPITIGRDHSNLLALPDDKRIVSKAHAEIRITEEAMEVADLGSKNFTYLNGERLSGTRTLDSGDILRIGDFELHVHWQKVPAAAASSASPGDDRTVFAFNPFWEVSAGLREALLNVQKVFARENPGRRREALDEALREVLGEELLDTGPMSEVSVLVARALEGGDGASVPQEEGPAPSAPPVRPSGSSAPSAPSAPSKPSYWRHFEQTEATEPEGIGASASAKPGARRASSGAGADAWNETLLASVAGLLGIPWHFRHEFIGQTIMQSESAAALYDGDAEALGAYLFDPSLPPEETERRRQAFLEAAEALRLHQVALIDGYKASVQQGTQRFFDEVDLDRMQAEVAASAKWYEKPMVRFRAIRRLQEKVTELRREDWTATERRVFRPAFIKAYLSRMTSPTR